MSSALQKFLQQHDSLDLGMEEFTDGEQKLVVHEEPEASIDYVTKEMVEAELKQTEIARDCDAILEATTAMEAYLELLQVGLENGGITAESAAFFAVGMERYETMFGGEQIVPSVEAFGGSSSKHLSTQVSAEGIKETLNKAWEITKRVLRALWDAMRDFATKATNAAKRLEERAKKVAAEAREKSDYQPKSSSIPIKGAAKVSVGKGYRGEDADTIAGLVTFSKSSLPSAVATYISDVASAAKQAAAITRQNDDGTIAFDNLEILVDLKAIKNAAKLSSFTKGESDQRFPAGTEVLHTETLPGNQAFYIVFPKNEGDLKQRLSSLQSKLHMGVYTVKNVADSPNEHTIQLKANPTHLVARAEKIGRIAGTIANADRELTKVTNALKQLSEAGDELAKKAGEADMSSGDRAIVNAALRGIAAVQKMGTGVNGALSYCVRTLGAQLAICERELAAYVPAGEQRTLPAPN